MNSSQLANKKDKSFFDENGYSGAFSIGQDTLWEFKTSIKQAKRISDRKKVENLLKKRDNHIKCRLMYELSTHPSVLDHVSELLGKDLILWITHTICRPPKDKGQPWHVDRRNKDVDGVHVSMAITDMNLSNGCMHVIPKSHKYRELSNSFLADKEKSGEVDLNDIQSVLSLVDTLHPENSPHQSVPIELKSGEYCLTKGGLLHGVSPNVSDGTRMVLIARYMIPQNRVFIDFDDRPLSCITVKGKDQYKKNLTYSPPLKLFNKSLYFNHLINLLSSKIRTIISRP